MPDQVEQHLNACARSGRLFVDVLVQLSKTGQDFCEDSPESACTMQGHQNVGCVSRSRECHVFDVDADSVSLAIQPMRPSRRIVAER